MGSVEDMLKPEPLVNTVAGEMDPRTFAHPRQQASSRVPPHCDDSASPPFRFVIDRLMPILWTALGVALLLITTSPHSAAGDQAELPATRLARAWKVFYDNSPQAALPLFKELLRQDPYKADVQYGLGRCLLETGHDLSAGEYLRNAATLETANPEYQFYLGVWYYRQASFEEAIRIWASCQKTLRRRPPGPLRRDHAWLTARAYLALGALDLASDWFERAFEVGGVVDGKLNPPSAKLERTLKGDLPGEKYEPTLAGGALEAGEALVIAAEGLLWKIAGNSLLRERISLPEPGWRDAFPAADPRSARLACVSRDPKGSHWLFLLKAPSARRKLIEKPVLAVRPAWSSDGSELAFVARSRPTDSPRVHLLNVGSGEFHAIPWPQQASTDPSFSRLERLIFATPINGRPALAVLPMGAQSGALLEPFPMTDPFDASTLPRDPQVVVLERRPVAPGVPGRKGASDTHPHPMRIFEPWETHGPGGPDSLSPDGAGPLDAPQQNGARGNVDTGSTDSGVPRMLLSGDSGVASDDSGEKTGGTDIEMSPATLGARQPSAAPNQEGRIAYTGYSGHMRRIWVRLPRLEVEQAATPPDKDCYAPEFSPDGQSLVFLCNEGGTPTLYRFDILTRELVQFSRDLPLPSSACWLPKRDIE